MLLREYIPNITNPKKTILFFHVGGWTIDSVETYNDMVKYFADYLSIKIFSLEYSLAPENKFPNALLEAEQAFNWLINNGNHPSNISFCGDSAGAHMIASLSYKLLKQNSAMPNSLLMIYPPCDPLFQKESIELFKDKYFLLNEDLYWFWDKLKSNKEDENNPLFNHLKFDLEKKLPPTILVTAGFDPICDEGNAYAEILKKHGTDIKALNYPTLFHNFAFMTKLKAAKKAVHNFLDEYKKIV
jgi:acetyl esterase